MIWETLFVLTAPFLIGGALWLCLSPLRGGGVGGALVGISLSVGLGIGLISCGFFLWLLAFSHPGEGFLGWVTVLVVFCLVLGRLLCCRGKRFSREDRIAPSSDRKLRAFLFVGLGIMVLLGITLFLLRLRETPHGSVDAWMFWNMRARFLFRAGEHWREAFLPHTANPSYPLMIPSAVAAIWSCIQREWSVVPKWIAACYTAATVVLLGGSLVLLRGLLQALIAVIALLSLPSFVIRGASQVSDVPLAFYFLATLALLSLYDLRFHKNAKLLLLAGTMAGFSAWTKNEGLLFLLVLFLGRGAVVAKFQGGKAALREIAFLGAGLAPVLAILFYFKFQIAAPNDLVAAASNPDFVVEKVSSAPRYAQVALFYLERMFGSGTLVLFNPLIPLAVLALFLKFRMPPEFRPHTAFMSVVLVLMLTGYFTVHLLVPYDLNFYLEHSVTRLLIQLWPSFLLLFFTVLRTPEESWATSSVARGTK